MGRRKSTVNFVAVSDITKPATDQEGILVTVEGRGGDTATNRAKALELVNRMWEDGEIAAEHFPDGVTQDNLFYVPDDSPEPIDLTELPPVVQGAQEIIQLTKLQLEAQDAADDAAPYIPIIEAVLARTRPLTPEERDLAKERKYGKVIERMGAVIASQEDYQARCTGHGQLILNAIAWQNQHKSAIAPSEEE